MSALSSITGGLSAADYASEPYAIQHGDKAAKTAYSEGLGFEQVFLDQLTEQLTATLSGDSSDPTDSTDSTDSSDGSSGSAAGPYSSLLSSALTQGVMSSGGAGGLAMQLAESIDPSLAHPTTK